MTDQINLTQLRQQIANQAEFLDVDYCPLEHDVLLALIDTAEAAIGWNDALPIVLREIRRLITIGEPDAAIATIDVMLERKTELEETLTRYTT